MTSEEARINFNTSLSISLPSSSSSSQGSPMPPSKLNPSEKANISGAQSQNGIASSASLFSEMAMLELLQPPAQGLDDHLIEFSEALKTVAKALRQAAEGKASAQAEAAEWREKYELERARNLQLEDKGKLNLENGSDVDDVRTYNPANKPALCDEQSKKCCASHGICSHEVLWDGMPDPDSLVVRKASFKLSWCCKGEQSDQHKHISLKWESCPRMVLMLTKPNSVSVQTLCAEMIRWLRDQKKLDIYVEPRVRGELMKGSSCFDFLESWEDDEEISRLHTKVDIVITLGGDGTVLWAASMFKGPVPPIVPFSSGSLGFMTPFYSEHYREYLESILKGPIGITLRNRLICQVVRNAAKKEHETEEPMLVLNEVTIDRGISSFLTNLNCYCDDSFVTCVQGDGLIISTTSGSTAYSLAAGGSMVHPQVPGILFTPVCPHSLSFRPLILPEHVSVRVEIPANTRSPAWASFDGKNRKKLEAGDALVCSMASWPVPTACLVDSTNDFLRSIHEGLHWNLRKAQSFNGPDDT
ncbi:hypothetical protein K1719_043173 [Acacia pycnantha]|nr:hypothetical protein K1719_043173 [Acacia pycnantha]